MWTSSWIVRNCYYSNICCHLIQQSALLPFTRLSFYIFEHGSECVGNASALRMYCLTRAACVWQLPCLPGSSRHFVASCHHLAQCGAVTGWTWHMNRVGGDLGPTHSVGSFSTFFCGRLYRIGVGIECALVAFASMCWLESHSINSLVQIMLNMSKWLFLAAVRCCFAKAITRLVIHACNTGKYYLIDFIGDARYYFMHDFILWWRALKITQTRCLILWPPLGLV